MVIAFYGFLFIIAIEYIGLGNYLSFINHLHVTLLLSFVLLLFVIIKYPVLYIFKHRQTKIMIIFIIFTLFSISYAIVKTHAFNAFQAQLGYFILFIISYCLLTDIKRIKIYMFSMLIFHFIIILVNINELSASAHVGVFKAGYFMRDGNDLAWSLAIILPYSLYLIKALEKFQVKLVVSGLLATVIFGIVGTASRGAAIAVVTSFVYLIIVSKRKILLLFLTGIVVIVIVSVTSESFMERMKSVRDYDSDSSVRGRFVAWKAATNMGLDHLLGVGAGNFSSAYGRFYRDIHADDSMWAPGRWISAHSIYFLAIGEYGFPGLILLLCLLFFNFRDNTIPRNKTIESSEKQDLQYLLPTVLNMSLFAYATGGIFLGGLNYPHIYLLTSLILRSKSILSARA